MKLSMSEHSSNTENGYQTYVTKDVPLAACTGIFCVFEHQVCSLLFHLIFPGITAAISRNSGIAAIIGHATN